MNKKTKWIAAIVAVLLIIALIFAVRSCESTTKGPEVEVSATLSATVTPETETEETTNTTAATLDPDASYVEAGVGENLWDDDEDTTEETTKPAEATKPNNTEPEDTTVPSTEPEQDPERTKTEYELYMEMSAEEQKKKLESFATVQEFFDWLERAKQEYEDSLDYIEIDGNGPVDIDGILDKNG